ncbi:MAG: hypothetical protein NXI32_06720 [bacterium]|nr:hypothetical protein [bacterium]
MRIASTLLYAAFRFPRDRYISLALSVLFLLSLAGQAKAAEIEEGSSSRSAKKDAVRNVPFHKLNNQVSGKVRDVVENPSYFRRMPSQVVECDPQMFSFLVRRPEVMVNIWQIMGITKVTAQRLNPYSFYANDGVGTTCRCDLVYADQNMHIYLGDGTYDGTLAPRKVTGSCVCILRTDAQANPSGKSFVQGQMDVFLKLDNLGADILARSVGPFVSKTADYNFLETAKFISQISQVCERSPGGAQNLAMKLENCDVSVRREFALIAEHISKSKFPGSGSEHEYSQWQAVAGAHESAAPAHDPTSSPALGFADNASQPSKIIHLSDISGDPGTSSRVPADERWSQTNEWRATRSSNDIEVPQRSRMIAPLKLDPIMKR